jgi:hypothetical protein
VLLAGEPIDEPVVQYGPFVLNSEAEVQRTFMDYRSYRNGFERARGWESDFVKAQRAAGGGDDEDDY